MKKIMAALIAVGVVGTKNYAVAEPHYEKGQLYTIECTAYCDTGITSTGVEIPADGSLGRQIAAFAPEYYGWIAVVTMPDGTNEIYEIQDTGSAKYGVRTGEVMDLWMPTENACEEFGRQQLQVYFVKGEG